MKRIKRILALSLCMVIMGGSLAGCGKAGTGKESGNSPKEIEIAIWNAGLGVKWLENMIKGFEKKYPDYKVHFTATGSASATTSAFGLEDVDTVDIYMSTNPGMDFKNMEPLDDVLTSTAKGESKTIGDKFYGTYLLTEQAQDGHTYTLTYGGGTMNFAYNKELFEQAGIKQLPRTTTEFVAVCDTLYGKGIVPLCHFTQGGYYEWLLNLYVAQYNGYDYFINSLYANKDASGKSPSKEALANKDGRYEALKVFEKFITPEYTLLGSNTKSHTEIQTEFINGKAAMMFNGSWLSNEMASTGSMESISAMRAPVLSAIIQRLETVDSDLKLRKVVTAVDQVIDGEKDEASLVSGENYVIDDLTISAEDWKIVYEARNTTASNYSGSDAFIPIYSNAKEGAKLFLQYMYSDEGYQIYMDTIHVPLPLAFSTGESVDLSGYSDFEKFQFNVLEHATNFAEPHLSSQSRLFIDGGIDIMINMSYADKLSSQNDRDRMSADEIWERIQASIENNYELIWLKNIK